MEDTTPGPGSYLSISKVSKPKAGKTATSFGNSKRFEANSVTVAPSAGIGPGSYNVGFKFGKQTKAKKVVDKVD